MKRTTRNPLVWVATAIALAGLFYACRSEGPETRPSGKEGGSGKGIADDTVGPNGAPVKPDAEAARPRDLQEGEGAPDPRKDSPGNSLSPADRLKKSLQPKLWQALQDYKAGKSPALPPPAIVVDKSVPNLDVVVFLHEPKEPPAVEGVLFRSRVGAIVSASCAITAIERLGLHAAVRYVAFPEQMKPKNDTATGGSLAVAGQITIPAEIDDYTYSAVAGEVVTIRVHASDNPATLDPLVGVLDTTPTLLQFDDNNGPGFDARLTFTFPTTATFIIRVVSSDGSVGPYHLIVESNQPALASSLVDITAGNPTRYVGSSVLAATAGGTTGNNVLIGIIDSGIAWYHQDLIAPSGASRILFLWDQARSDGVAPDVGADGNPANDYGVEYSRAAINALIANLPTLPPQPWPGFDSASHGTAVAGTAAGDGSDTDGGEPAGRYRGVSLGSDILFVRMGGSGNILDALVYLASKAVELGRPIVINVSLGSNMGPHDGKGPEAQVADLITGPGRIMVVAAGNEGINPIHARTTIAAAGTAVLGYTILEPADADVDIWADAGDQFTVTVTSPGAQVLSATSGTSNSGTLDGWTISIANRQGGPSALNGDTQMFIQFIPPNPLPGAPIPGWSISLTRTTAGGSGQIDAYASVAGTGAQFTTFVPPGFEPLSVEGTLTDLATAASVLTVGAYSTKYRWDSDVGGGTKTDPLAQVLFGALGHFSSRGPTRKGAVKPDITGPGNKVAATVSQESLGVATDPTDVGLDGRHVHLSGTSFSSPHVAGIVALMLEKNRYLSPADVRTALQTSANTDQATGLPVTAPNSWGAGKVNAAGALVSTPTPPANSPPAAPAAVEQRDSALALLAVGATVTAGAVRIQATVTDPDAHYMKLQVEVKPITVAFDGTGTLDSPFVTSGELATVILTSLTNDSYHWRARVFDTGGGGASAALSSAWVAFGGNMETEADFILAVPPALGGGGGGGGGCGATGLELLVPLGVFAWLRRRRR